MNNFIKSTVPSSTNSVNDLVVFNAPSSVFSVDEVKRAQVRALDGAEQYRWAQTSVEHMRDLFITASDSVEVANTNMAAFCIALNEVLSGEAWIILGYKSAEECIQAELSLEKIGKVRQARGEVANVLKNVGGFSNRIIASIMGVSHQTINKDIQTTSGQLATNLPVAQSSSSGHHDQKLLGLDGKRRSEKRDSDAVMRDFLEFSYLYEFEDKSSREIEEMTGTPYKTVQNTLSKADEDVFHKQVSQLFVQARRKLIAGATRAGVIMDLGLTSHGLEYLLSDKGWMNSSLHNHGDDLVPVKSMVACMLWTPSIDTWITTSSDTSRTSLLMDDDAHTPVTVSELALLLGQAQSNVTYHLNKWKQGRAETAKKFAVQEYLNQKEAAKTTPVDVPTAKTSEPKNVQVSSSSAVSGSSSVSSQTSTVLTASTPQVSSSSRMSEVEAIDAMDEGEGWTLMSLTQFNTKSLAEQMTSLWCDHIRVLPMTMGEMADEVQRQADYLLDSKTPIDAKQSRRMVSMVTGELHAFTNLDDCITLIGDILPAVAQTSKTELLEAVNDRLASLNRLRDALTNPRVRTGLSTEEYTRAEHEYTDEADIAELMNNSWL